MNTSFSNNCIKPIFHSKLQWIITHQWTWNLIGDLFNTSSHLTWQGITILSQKKADMPHDQIVQKKLHCCGGRRWGDSLKFSYFVICLVFTFISSLWGHGQESWDGNSRLSNCHVFEVLLLVDFVVKEIDFNQNSLLCFVSYKTPRCDMNKTLLSWRVRWKEVSDMTRFGKKVTFL